MKMFGAREFVAGNTSCKYNKVFAEKNIIMIF